MIEPGTAFVDDRGRVAQLHGIGIQQLGETFWAWGENKEHGATFTSVAAYSSPDLVHWRFEGDALTPGEGDLTPDRIVERPKVLQRPDGAFVMLLHIDEVGLDPRSGTHRYVDARVGYAIADSPAGPFRYVHGARPLGNESRDIGVYTEDGVGYLLSEDREQGTAIYRLADDYLSAVERVALIADPERRHPGYESPTLVKHEGRYYLFGSDLTGWHSNDNVVATAERLEGPWSPWQHFAPPGSNTWDSQVSVVLPVVGVDGVTRHLYVGDRWDPDDLENSGAVWLPIEIGGGGARLEWRDRWDPVTELRLP